MSSRRRGATISLADLPDDTAPAAAPAQAARPYTVVGLMADAMAGADGLRERAQKLEQENEALKARQGPQALDPATIRPSRWANRHEAAFAGDEFQALKAEIADAHGNVQPIMVRPLEGEAGAGQHKYELVFGHRRHRACLELGIPVNAVVKLLDDRDLFGHMERENRNRANLSAYEQGVMYRRALDEGLFPSVRTLAQHVGRDPTAVSEAVRIARLPTEVIGAFPSPLEIQFRWATPLTEACAADLAGVLQRAKGIQGHALPAAKVMDALTSRAQPAAGAGGGRVGPSYTQATNTGSVGPSYTKDDEHGAQRVGPSYTSASPGEVEAGSESAGGRVGPSYAGACESGAPQCVGPSYTQSASADVGQPSESGGQPGEHGVGQSYTSPAVQWRPWVFREGEFAVVRIPIEQLPPERWSAVEKTLRKLLGQ